MIDGGIVSPSALVQWAPDWLQVLHDRRRRDERPIQPRHCDLERAASCAARRCAVGELVNEAELDWDNIAEEIESVGRSDLHAVTSWLMQEPRHDLKTEAWP